MHRSAGHRSARIAIRIAHADGHDEAITFAQSPSGRRAAQTGWPRGWVPGDRVAIMLEPSLPFYMALFGAMKLGAVAVPLFTLFGPDGVRLRVDDCAPRLLLTTAEKADRRHAPACPVDLPDDVRQLAGSLSDTFAPATRARRSGDLPVYVRHNARTAGGDQTHPSRHRRGHDRSAVRHRHPSRRPVLLPVIAGLGPWAVAWHPGAAGARGGDRDYAGTFDAERLLKALQDFGTTNLSAAATHYRMMSIAARRHVSLHAVKTVVHRRTDGQ